MDKRCNLRGDWGGGGEGEGETDEYCIQLGVFVLTSELTFTHIVEKAHQRGDKHAAHHCVQQDVGELAH